MSTREIEIANRVRRILVDSPFAVLSTVGEGSEPFARWMTPVFARGDLKEFHALAAPRSRKVEHIKKNPRVAWVFSTPAWDEVVTLHGTASIEDDPGLRAEVWERMPEKHRAFILNDDANLCCVVIATRVERIEYLRPLEGQTVPVPLAP